MSALAVESTYLVNDMGGPIEACAVEDPELHYDADDIDRSGDDQHPKVREAKQVCLRCDFRESCLADALERNEQWGVWGAMTTRERRALSRRQRRAVRQPERLPGL